ncbi:unnamed protein product [Prunus armeniaca]
MSNLRRVLERQHKEEEEIRRKRADEEDREADEEKEEMLAATVCMFNQSRQHCRHRAPNVDIRRESQEQKLIATLRMLGYGASANTFANPHRGTYKGFYKKLRLEGKKSIILEAVALFDCWVWHAFFGVAGSQNDLNVLGQSLVFNEVLRGHSPQITYQINNIVYFGAYYLADEIYPRWTTFIKTISNPQSEKETSFVAFQEGYMKDVERCFGILQAHWAIIRGAARMLDEEVLRSIMMTCIILHSMIMEDEYDYDAP